MPSTTGKQAKFMAACSHGAGYDSCPPKKVSTEFNQADKGSAMLSNAMRHHLAWGGRPMPQMNRPPTNTGQMGGQPNIAQLLASLQARSGQNRGPMPRGPIPPPVNPSGPPPMMGPGPGAPGMGGPMGGPAMAGPQMPPGPPPGPPPGALSQLQPRMGNQMMPPQGGPPPGMMQAMPVNPQGGMPPPQMPPQGMPPQMMRPMPMNPGMNRSLMAAHGGMVQPPGPGPSNFTPGPSPLASLIGGRMAAMHAGNPGARKPRIPLPGQFRNINQTINNSKARLGNIGLR